MEHIVITLFLRYETGHWLIQIMGLNCGKTMKSQNIPWWFMYYIINVSLLLQYLHWIFISSYLLLVRVISFTEMIKPEDTASAIPKKKKKNCGLVQFISNILDIMDIWSCWSCNYGSRLYICIDSTLFIWT